MVVNGDGRNFTISHDDLTNFNVSGNILQKALKIKRNLEECLKSLNNLNFKKIFFIVPKNSKNCAL